MGTIIFGIIIGGVICFLVMSHNQKINQKKDETWLDDIAYQNREIFWKYCKITPANKFAWHIRCYTSTRNISLRAIENLAQHIELLNKLVGSDQLFSLGLVEQSDGTHNSIIYRGPEIHGDEQKYISVYNSSGGKHTFSKITLTEEEANRLVAFQKVIEMVNMITNTHFIVDISYLSESDIDLANQYIANLESNTENNGINKYQVEESHELV